MSCLHCDCSTFFIVCIVQDVPLLAIYSLGTPQSSAVGVCFPLKYRSVDLLDQGTLMYVWVQRVSSLVSLGFDRMKKRV